MARLISRKHILIIGAALLASGCSKRTVPQFEVNTCMQHLSEMDAETRNECIQAHTAWPANGHDPLAEFGKNMEEARQPKPAENPEDRRLDARGVK